MQCLYIHLGTRTQVGVVWSLVRSDEQNRCESKGWRCLMGFLLELRLLMCWFEAYGMLKKVHVGCVRKSSQQQGSPFVWPILLSNNSWRTIRLCLLWLVGGLWISIFFTKLVPNAKPYCPNRHNCPPDTGCSVRPRTCVFSNNDWRSQHLRRCCHSGH